MAAFYVNFRCGIGDARDAGKIQREALQRYRTSQQTFIEGYVLRQIAYPPNQRIGAAFIARILRDGTTADVVVTGAAYHGRDLCAGKMSAVSFVQTTKETFSRRYLQPLEVPTVAASLLLPS